MCRGCHGFCNEVLKKMRQGCDEDEDDEVLVSWLVVDYGYVVSNMLILGFFFLSFVSGVNLNLCLNFGVM